MTSTALARYNDAPVYEAVLVEDKPIRVGVGQLTSVSNMSVSLPIVGFVALGSILAGFVVGVAVCDILERG